MKNGNDVPDLPDSPSPDLHVKLPGDVKFVGWLHIVAGVGSLPIGVLIMAGVLDPFYADRGVFRLFGMVHLTSGFCLGLDCLVMGLLSAVTGYGLLKRHPLGWWLLLVTLLHGVANSIADERFHGPNVIVWPGLTIIGLMIAWLIFRARLYHPFGKVLKLLGK